MITRKLVSLAALVATLAGVLVGLWLTSRHLPAQVASHFNAAGAPDDWMSRNAYMWVMAGLLLGTTAFLVGVFYCVRFFPVSAFNLPHRDHWLAAERRQETFDFIFRAGLWLATLEAVFFLGVHLLVVAANDAQPAKLSSFIWLLAGGFLLATIGWSFWFIQRFRRPAERI